MFEKEAEEYATVDLPDGYTKIDYQKKVDWQKGAEFGFQKGINARINTTTISDCPIKDEWHFVKSGDLPPEDTKVLALMSDNEICIAHFYRINVWDKIGTVVAWKEITLPKEYLNYV